MSIHHVLARAAGATLWGFALAAPVAAQVSVAADGMGTTPGRLRAIVAAVLGLISVIIGGVALVRPGSRIGAASGRLGAILALVVGLIGTGLSGLHLATSPGAIGTGGGRAGAIVALVVGLIGMVLGGVAMTRTKSG